MQEGEQAEYGDSELRAEVRALQERRLLRTLALTQDISDALLAVSDIRGAHFELHRCCWLSSSCKRVVLCPVTAAGAPRTLAV